MGKTEAWATPAVCQTQSLGLRALMRHGPSLQRTTVQEGKQTGRQIIKGREMTPMAETEPQRPEL